MPRWVGRGAGQWIEMAMAKAIAVARAGVSMLLAVGVFVYALVYHGDADTNGSATTEWYYF